MSDCIFCKIAAGEIPADVIYQDDKILAFKDINPAAPVHILIISKEHLASLNDTRAPHKELLGEIMLIAREIAEEQGIAESGYRVLTNINEQGGQEVFHLHFHLIGGRQLGKFA